MSERFLEEWHEACAIAPKDGPLVRRIKTDLALGVPLPVSQRLKLACERNNLVAQHTDSSFESGDFVVGTASERIEVAPDEGIASKRRLLREGVLHLARRLRAFARAPARDGRGS